MQRKKPGRKAEPPSKRRIAWPRWTGFRGMTVRDWLQLLIVPLVLVGIGLLFEMQQADRQQAMEEQQQALEERRAEAERNLAEQRAQDEALQAYLDQMSTLLLETDLRNSEEDSEVRTLARARTLTVLGRLDPTRKRAVMKFLAEARLIQRVDERAPIIRLGGADLHGTDLAGLVPAPRDALRGVDLNSADLSDADLSGNDLTGAILAFANLSGANLRGANLTGANVAVANLRSSDLIFANLTDADLSDADLKDAKLIGAEGMTREELEQQGAFLGGATMPYETVLPRGYYSAAGFQPALSLIFGQGWEESNGRPKVFEGGLDIFAEGTEGGQLSFTNLPTVFDPSNLRELKEVPAPESADEWVSWFQSHPNLETSKPVPVSVGGASGVRIDVTETSAPENYPQEVCGEQPCVPLYLVTVLSAETKNRFVIVDVEDETVIINVSAPPDKFDEFLPKAQKVLDTVEWKRE